LIHHETPSESELTDENLLLQWLSGRTNIDPVKIKEMLLGLVEESKGTYAVAADGSRR
jgi:hypothetical protein